MRTIKKVVYTFEELSDKAKQKAIENNRSSVDSYMVQDSMDCEIDSYWNPKLETMGFHGPEIKYSGFYSQGDGASFTADIDIEKIINTFTMWDIIPKDRLLLYHKMLKMADLNIIELSYSVSRISSSYLHENTVYVDNNSEFYLYSIDNNKDKTHDYFDEAFDQLKEDIADFVHDLCQEIYISLKNIYKDMMSDEYQIEDIKCNEMEFYEDGSFYYE